MAAETLLVSHRSPAGPSEESAKAACKSEPDWSEAQFVPPDLWRGHTWAEPPVGSFSPFREVVSELNQGTIGWYLLGSWHQSCLVCEEETHLSGVRGGMVDDSKKRHLGFSYR